MDPLAVEFEIADPGRFELLRTVFNALRAAKAAGNFTEDHSGWVVYFDDAARSAFWWPTQAETDEWLKRWNETPVEQRLHDPSLHRPWDFESMIDAFANGEYDLGECKRVNETTGRLTFYEHAFPFGGSGCMRALIEAFGHRVTRDYDDGW
jgi:hypothetical protein